MSEKAWKALESQRATSTASPRQSQPFNPGFIMKKTAFITPKAQRLPQEGKVLTSPGNTAPLHPAG